MTIDLPDWTDWDVTEYEIGRYLGFFRGQNFREAKPTIWANTTLGETLSRLVDLLVADGVLEQNGDDQFRVVQRDTHRDCEGQGVNCP